MEQIKRDLGVYLTDCLVIRVESRCFNQTARANQFCAARDQPVKLKINNWRS